MADFKWDDQEVVPGTEAKADPEAKGDSKGFDWNDHEVVPTAKPDLILGAGGFNPEKAMMDNIVAPIEAAGAGAVQGGTFGLADEISGAVNSGHMSGPEYQKERDASRAYFLGQQQQHPAAYPVGQVLGTLATSQLPLVGVAGEGAGWAENAARAGASAGLQGAGQSTAELTGPNQNLGQFAKDVGVPAVTAATLGAAFPALFNKSVLGAATKQAINPATGIAEEVPDMVKLAGQYGKSALASGAAGAAIGAATNPDDPMSGAVKGGLAGLPVGPLLRTGVGIGNALGESELGQRVTKAFQAGQKGQLLVGKGAAEQVARELGDVSSDISNLAQNQIVGNEGKDAYAAIDKVSDKVKNFISKSKEIKGKQLGNIIEGLASSDTPVDVTALTTNLMDDIDQSVSSGLVDESRVKGLRAQLQKLKEVTQPDVKATMTTRTAFDPELGQYRPGSTTAKLGGKNVSLEDLKNLQQDAVNVTPGAASITDTELPSGASLNTETQQNILSQPAIPRTDVTVDELLKTKNLVSKGLKSTDPNQRALYERAYGQLIEDLTSRLDDPRAQAAYKDLRGEYSNLIKLDKKTLAPNIAGQLEPSNATNNAIEDYSKPVVGRQQDKLNEMLDLMKKAGYSDESAQRLKGQAAVASKSLQDVQGLAKNINPDQIAKQIPSMESPIQYQTSPLKKTLDRLKQVAPEQALPLEQRAKELSGKLDILNGKAPIESHGLSPKGMVTGIVGGVKQGVVKGGNLLGYLTKATNNPARLGQIAAAVESQGNSQLGRIIRNSMSKDSIGRAATLFTVQQNPGYRKQLQDISPQFEEDDNDDKSAFTEEE